MRPQSCDTMVALGNTTRNGQTLFAKNSDRPAQECQPLIQHPRNSYKEGEILDCQFVTLPQVNTTYRHIGSRPYWCWGYEHGFNEHQVVIGNEALPSRLPEAHEPKLIGMEILRLGLERARTAAEAVEVMTDLISQYGQGKFANEAGVRTYDNGYIVADPHKAYVIETAGHEWAVKRVESTLGISNVYSVETDWIHLSPNAKATAVAQEWWPNDNDGFNFADAYTRESRNKGSGAMRRSRSCAVLKQQAGEIDVQTMMALLSDHSDGQSPNEPFQTNIGAGPGICMHPKPDGTGGCSAASLVADLCADGSRLSIYWCSFYSPCLGLFLPIFIEGDLPPILSSGDATASTESPWWRFYHLNLAVLADPESLTPLVRGRWAGMQEVLFNSTYQTARSGAQLFNDGQVEEARQLLSDYMAQNVATMMATITDIMHELETEKVLA